MGELAIIAMCQNEGLSEHCAKITELVNKDLERIDNED